MRQRQAPAPGIGGRARLQKGDITGFFLLFLVILAVCAAATWNASKLRTAINASTRSYVSDVSYQLASDIDFRLEKNILDLESLADSLIALSPDDNASQTIQSFLTRKANLLGFTSLAVLGTQGRICRTDNFPLTAEEMQQLRGVKTALQGENSVSFLLQESVLYSIPIWKDGQVVGVLGGVRDKANMQALIQTGSFSNRCLTCIIDTIGDVVISPSEVEPFLQLDDIFLKESDSQAARDIEKMRRDIRASHSGVFFFTSSDESRLVLSYVPLSSYDWVLLTLVPADLISQETDQYIAQSFLILGAIVILFLVILLYLIRLYRRHYRQLAQVALRDSVTGGMNNAAFQLRAEELLRAAPANSYSVALLNIHNFKLINENFGSGEGNRTLCRVMRVLEAHLQEQEAAARADADNFFLCLRQSDPQVVRQRLQELVDAINSFDEDGRVPYRLAFQRGAYLVDDPELEITVIQDRVKTACRASTDDEGACVFYDAALTQQLQRERDLSALFDRSLENGDFQVLFQPKVWLESNRVGGAEALVRWNHPQQGVIPPSDFIPLFERSQKICRLDLYVFEQVCKTMRRWLEEGRPPLPISVNLSRQHFKRPDFLEEFREIAQRWQVPTHLIELELTESILFDDRGIAYVREQIEAIHRMGFRFSLDDFGAGYSSLGLLMEFDVDVLKLDRRFFLHVQKERTRDVVSAVTNLARQIGAHTVAEGIETSQQLEFLRAVHCDLVQGYIYSPPLPIAAFEDWVRNWEAR